MPLTLKTRGMIPPGGWKYQTPHGEFTAATADELAARIASYREANHLEPGDPKQELTEQLCSKWPDWCTGWPPGSPQNSPAKPNGSRVRNWLAQTLYATRAAAELVDPVTAAARAETCRACPKHAQASFCCGGKGGARIIATKIARARSEGSDLVQCDTMNYDCYAAVNLPASILPDSSKAPETCWLRKERGQ